jgi:hypothetical protein
VNRVKAGSVVPIRFGLGGDVLATGSSQGGRRYDPVNDEYSSAWRTEGSWAGRLREVTLTLAERSTHTARFLCS